MAQHRVARAVCGVDLLALGMGRGGMPVSVPLRQVDLLGGVLIAMWNYMGWDNLSTIAGEVEAPQRTYSRAMFGAVVLVVVSYVLPVAAVARTGIDPNSWTAGGWADVARLIGGETLAVAIALAGVIGAIGSFSALMLSFTRLPLVMAEDGYLPRVVTRRHSRTGAPWVAIIACGVLWAVCYPLGFEKNLVLDVLLTGLSILLEFWALVALRIREPELVRPFRVPGGITGAIVIGLPPLALMVAAVVRNRSEFCRRYERTRHRHRNYCRRSVALFSQPNDATKKSGLKTPGAMFAPNLYYGGRT